VLAAKLNKVTIKSPNGDFVAGLNPTDYSLSLSNDFDCKASPGSSQTEPRFKGGNNPTLKLTLVFDGTGATGLVTGSGESCFGSIRTSLKAFLELLKYQGSQHAPPPLTVVWDQTLFKGYMSSAEVSYKLFDHNGTPVRAEVAATFISGLTAMEIVALEGKTSPDVHRVHVCDEGERLDHIAKAAYGDTRYWAALAKANGLVNPRGLVGGQRLLLPRLEQGLEQGHDAGS